MVRSIVDEAGIFGAYEILKLVMAMFMIQSGHLRTAVTEIFSLLRNAERVEVSVGS